MPVNNILSAIMTANELSLQLSRNLLEIQRTVIDKEKETGEEDLTYDLLREIQVQISEVNQGLTQLATARLAIAGRDEVRGANNDHYRPLLEK